MALRSQKNKKEPKVKKDVKEPEAPEMSDAQVDDTAEQEASTMASTPDATEPDVMPETTGQDQDAGGQDAGGQDDGAKAAVPSVREQRAVAMPATKGQFAVIYDALVDVIPPVDFGILTRLKASNGSILTGDNDDLGKTIEIELYSVSHKYVTSPQGNNKAARALCKFSADPDNIPGYWDDEEEEWVNDGVTVTAVRDYITWLKKEHGYTKAGTKHYLELLCMLRDADEDNDAIGQMVQISLSPQSVKQFTGFGLHTTLKVNAGQLNPDDAKVFKLTAKMQSFDSNDFTIFTFHM